MGSRHTNGRRLLRVRVLQEVKLEKTHENNFVDRAATYSCRAIKFEIVGDNGYPDRIVLCPGPHTFFIEFKRTEDHEPDPLQLRKHRLLRGMGYTVYVAWSLDQAEDFLLYELDKCQNNSCHTPTSW